MATLRDPGQFWPCANKDFKTVHRIGAPHCLKCGHEQPTGELGNEGLATQAAKRGEAKVIFGDLKYSFRVAQRKSPIADEARNVWEWSGTVMHWCNPGGSDYRVE